MSKTIATALCETNQARGLPQENIFIQNLYRLPSEYSSSFQRSAVSTAPVQICAIASAQGNDTLGAMALQEVMNILAGMVTHAQTRSVLDFDGFINHFITVSNSAVCNLSIKNQGAPLRVSFTMIIVEGDTMRIVSVGNTRAVLIRQGRVINLSEDQTAAHRYVQLGAITAEAENLHPERNVLTQYLGKFSQDGPVMPEKQIFMKLFDGDEISLLGTGITQGLPDNIRNDILVKKISPEEKVNELIVRCVHNSVKGGLTVLHLLIESTLLISAGAFASEAGRSLAASGAAAAGVSAAGSSASQVLYDAAVPPSADPVVSSISSEAAENSNARLAAHKRAKTIAIVRPIAVFLSCIIVGYLGLMFVFNVGNIMKPVTSPATDADGSAAVLNKIAYVNAEMTALYPDASLDNSPIAYLNRGDAVTVYSVDGAFAKVMTIDSVAGYIVASMLSDSDPTLGESQAEMSADPTPIPSKEQTAVTTSGSETKPAETVTDTSETTAETPTDPPTPSPTVPTLTPTETPTLTPTETPTLIPAETPTLTPSDTPTPIP